MSVKLTLDYCKLFVVNGNIPKLCFSFQKTSELKVHALSIITYESLKLHSAAIPLFRLQLKKCDPRKKLFG